MTTVMNKTLLDLLCCPSCHRKLELVAFDETDALSNRLDNGNSGIGGGTLRCSCGLDYPIIDAVPRLLECGQAASSIPDEPVLQRVSLPHPPVGKENDFDHIRKSFSKEWEIFDYDNDKTWGWTLDERKRVFLSDVGFRESELTGKLLLDAGCGNCTLTAALSTFGLEVVGMDLSDGLGHANLRKDRRAGDHKNSVLFVQGNLFNPPLMHGSFDIIYCSGVIHHTPNSKETFKKLVPLVRRGGRIYIWVYGRRALLVRIFFGIGRQLKRQMSLESLMTVCRIMAPLYKLGTEVLNALSIARFRGRTSQEITLDLFDAWAPTYNHWHTEGEVQGWFEEMGFTNITIAGRQKHGFGCYGDRVQPSSY